MLLRATSVPSDWNVMSEASAQACATYEFFATCAAGFEQLLAGEISNLSITNARPLRGQVAFSGTIEDAYRVCMWSRIASSVVVILARVDAKDSDELYEGVLSIAWEEHLPLKATIAIDAHGTNDELRNTQFVALRCKDAICDRMQKAFNSRPNVDTKNPDLEIVVRLRNNRATCGISLSGMPLFKRHNMSRSKSDNLGAMRADYAAAFLAAGGWYKCCRKENPVLINLYSGSGAVLVEAAAIALDSAPGLERARWGFAKWLKHDSEAWEALCKDAERRRKKGAKRAEQLNIIAFDERMRATSGVKHMLRAAGLSVDVQATTNMEKLAEALKEAACEKGNSLAVADLSWFDSGDLVAEASALNYMARIESCLSAATPLVVMSSSDMLDYCLARSLSVTWDVLVKRNEAAIRLYDAAGADEAAAEGQAGGGTISLKDGTELAVLVKASDQFAARLAKVAKERAKWAKREDVTCYRVYDADLPDYAVAIDLYQSSETSGNSFKAQRWLCIQEYEAPKEIEKALAHRRLLDVLTIAPTVLQVKRQNVFLRTRRRAKGGSQYADGGAQGFSLARSNKTDVRAKAGALEPALPRGSYLVDEGGLVFEVNFTDYLDTGLFLDHRDVRNEIREYAKQTKGSKRFLNLFAYTGTATCYAADGGAKYTTTVDLSTTYLDWARRNMQRNGFEGEEHEYVRADVVRWVSEQRHTPNRWDLVFCDPPTFSNSKRMGKASFDVQRDHAELLIGISRLLTANGMCVFSCNLRGFKPDTEKLAKAGVQIKDVTEGSIPEDFKRNAKIHHCYLVCRTPRETA